MYQPTNVDLRLPRLYSRRFQNDYFEDPIGEDAPGVWQPDVYSFAEALARRLDASRIVDLGCGNGTRISTLNGPFRTVGVDIAKNIEQARVSYPDRLWLEQDLEGRLESLAPVVPGSLLICSDVIEHLRNPLGLLTFVQRVLPSVYGLVISTPDRDRARGSGDQGPPANPAHTMEWTLPEFHSLLSSQGLAPITHGFTRNFSEAETRNTQVAFVPGGMSRLAAPRLAVRAIAFVPCFNEADIVSVTVSRLLTQGIDVHIIDNWSSDGSWEMLIDEFGPESRVTLERFPEAQGPDFDWVGILDRIDHLAAQAPHQWILHVDADEQVDALSADLSLLDVLSIADSAGYDVIDFTLIDFRPEAHERGPQASDSHVVGIPTRWQFANRPGARTLERAWKNRRSPVRISDSGGHALGVPKRVFPLNQILRHYPLRSPEQARRKIFRERLPRAAREKSQRGWHAQYDQYPADAAFVWSGAYLRDWDWHTTTEWVVEFSTRVGIDFDDYSLPHGFA